MNERDESSGVGIVITIVLVALFAILFFASQPTCKDGTIAMFTKFNGWNCVAGYKP